jgi:5-methylcytosine-specific restriction endonuclease McrA
MNATKKFVIQSSWDKFVTENFIQGSDQLVSALQITFQFANDYLRSQNIFDNSFNDIMNNCHSVQNAKFVQFAINSTNSDLGLVFLEQFIMELGYINPIPRVEWCLSVPHYLRTIVFYRWRKYLKANNSQAVLNSLYRIIYDLPQELGIQNNCGMLLNLLSGSSFKDWDLSTALNCIQNSKVLLELLNVLDTLEQIQRPELETGKKPPKKVKQEEVKEETSKKPSSTRKRTLTEAQKKKVAAKQEFKCANQPSKVTKGLDNYQCPMWLGKQGSFDESGYDIDHIVEVAEGGSDELDNLQALCICCHRVKTTRYLMNTKASKKANVHSP